MGGAIIGGTVKNKIVPAKNITVSDVNAAGLAKLKSEYGVNTVSDNTAVAKDSDILFLCVKPAVVYGIIDEIKDSLKKNATVVSIVAGQSTEKLLEAFGAKIKLVRVMPNTPALVGEGMAAISPCSGVPKAMLDKICKIFNGFGKAEIVPEKLMDAVTAVSGSSPAYVFMFIEAMADAAVAGGMPRKQAYTFAAQSVLGSAKMVLETGKHPGELKDMVCSPAGTTIEAVGVLEAEGFRGAVMDAIAACIEKSRNM